MPSLPSTVRCKTWHDTTQVDYLVESCYCLQVSQLSKGGKQHSDPLALRQGTAGMAVSSPGGVHDVLKRSAGGLPQHRASFPSPEAAAGWMPRSLQGSSWYEGSRCVSVADQVSAAAAATLSTHDLSPQDSAGEQNLQAQTGGLAAALAAHSGRQQQQPAVRSKQTRLGSLKDFGGASVPGRDPPTPLSPPPRS